MSRVTFPKTPFISQTYVGSDFRLYYWTGAKWRDLGKIILENTSPASDMGFEINDLQVVTDEGSKTTNTISHAPATEPEHSVNLEQLQDASIGIDVDYLLIRGKPIKFLESGTITNIDTFNIHVDFKKGFTDTVTKVTFKVYRMVPGAGGWMEQDVYHSHPSVAWFDLIGFDVIIDAVEPLAGVIIEYCFTE